MDQPPNIKEAFHVAGNAPDPTGGGLRGVEATHNLTAGALGHPQVLTPWKAFDKLTRREVPLVLEIDVYEDHIHLHCPVCLIEGRGEVGLRIRAGAKDYGYDPLARVPLWPGWVEEQTKIVYPNGLGGLVNVAPFRCTWETVGDLKRGFGLQKCGLFVSIRNNVMVSER